MIPRTALASAWLVSMAVLASACGASPPREALGSVVPPPSASATASVAQAPTSEPEPPPLPGDVRCGVDDEPVPVGDLQGPPRERATPAGAVAFDIDPVELEARQRRSSTFSVRAARPHAETQFTLAPTVNASPSFRERVAACGVEVDVGEITKLPFSVRFASTGTALWVRGQGVGASAFGACLLEAACHLEEGAHDRARTREGTFVSQIVLPEWRGKTEISNGPFPARVDPKVWRTYRVKAQPVLEEVAHGCARARPPAETFRVSVAFELDQDRRPRAIALGNALGPYPEYFLRCLGEGASKRVPRAPAGIPPGTPLTMQLAVFLPQDVPGQL